MGDSVDELQSNFTTITSEAGRNSGNDPLETARLILAHIEELQLLHKDVRLAVRECECVLTVCDKHIAIPKLRKIVRSHSEVMFSTAHATDDGGIELTITFSQPVSDWIGTVLETNSDLRERIQTPAG